MSRRAESRESVVPPVVAYAPFPGLIPVVQDRVTRANSATSPGRPTIGAPWSTVAGTVGVRNEKLYAPGGTGGDMITTSPVRQPLAMRADLYSPDWSLYQPMMIVRYVDASNYLGVRVRVSTGQLALFAVVDDVESVVVDSMLTDAVVNDTVITVESRFVAQWTGVVVDDVETPVETHAIYLNDRLAVAYTASVDLAALFHPPEVTDIAFAFVNTEDADASDAPTIDNIVALA